MKANFSSQPNSSFAVIKSSNSELVGNKPREKQVQVEKKYLDSFISLEGEARRVAFKNLTGSNGYNEKECIKHIADHFQMEAIDLNVFEPEPKVVSQIPKKLCNKFNVIPVTSVGDVLVIAVNDPGDRQMKEDLSMFLSVRVAFVVSGYQDIARMIQTRYPSEQEQKGLKNLFNFINLDRQGIEPSGPVHVDLVKDEHSTEPLVKAVNQIISKSVESGASDIHFEVYEKTFRVRFRVDGSLVEYMKSSAASARSLVSRIKVMCSMDIAEKRLPQDGRLRVKVNTHEYLDFRVSSMPVVNGEKVVMRLLSSGNLVTDIESLGMNPFQADMLKKHLMRSQGLIVLTGPTGSGKTTTIYTSLALLNTVDKNISTAEDPVEYKIEGLNQVQVSSKIGLTFASVLRAFLRQDPDVILIGEIRDFETAEMAYKAASTGHLVLSTLHTNDSVSTITRLIDIGIPSYSVADNTSLILAQRLIRRLCSYCKAPAMDISVPMLVENGCDPEKAEESIHRVMDAKGCQDCRNTGYKGRIAVYEVLELSNYTLRKAILDGVSPVDIKKMLIDKKLLQTLRLSAMKLLLNGETSLREVVSGTIADEI